MSTQLDALTAQVAANTTVLGSAKALIEGFSARLAAAGVDPAKLDALAAELKASDEALAAAVVANTPTFAALNPETSTTVGGMVTVIAPTSAT